jgi:WD40 repeat protein
MFKISNKIKYSGLVTFSPDNKYFAFSRSLDVLIYSTYNLKQINKFSFQDFIEKIEFSKDSNLILICMFKRGIIEAKSLLNPKFYIRISEGICGINYALFSPDSKNILTINENNINLSIYNLVSKKKYIINYPKFSNKGLCFSTYGNFLAILLKNSSQDEIGIYHTKSWSIINKFIPDVEDITNILWSFDNSCLILIESYLLCKFHIYLPTGEKIYVVEPYKNKIGILKHKLSPNGHYFAIGCYDQSVKIYNTIGYTQFCSFEHNNEILSDKKVNYFQEIKIDNNRTKFISINPDIKLEKTVSLNTDIKIGVKNIEFSYDSNFMASLNEKNNNILYIWELFNLSLQTVIIQMNKIKSFKWAKNQHILFINTENDKLYYFTLESIYVNELGDNFINKEFIFNEDGNKMIIKSENNFIIVDINSNNMLQNNMRYNESQNTYDNIENNNNENELDNQENDGNKNLKEEEENENNEEENQQENIINTNENNEENENENENVENNQENNNNNDINIHNNPFGFKEAYLTPDGI